MVTRPTLDEIHERLVHRDPESGRDLADLNVDLAALHQERSDHLAELGGPGNPTE